uniref:Uncharacterized protein n=1 Tax=Rhabditophanes sp. KR3021 TaxID=114890 RepID=A0AC35UD04_9BILA
MKEIPNVEMEDVKSGNVEDKKKKERHKPCMRIGVSEMEETNKKKWKSGFAWRKSKDTTLSDGKEESPQTMEVTKQAKLRVTNNMRSGKHEKDSKSKNRRPLKKKIRNLKMKRHIYKGDDNYKKMESDFQQSYN